MTKKTLCKILAFGLAIISLTTALMVSVFYSYYDKQTRNQLETVMALAQAELKENDSHTFINNTIGAGTRITLINSDGKVLADSADNADEMENHLNRPEIQQAVKEGEGFEKRQSETSNQLTYYYAKQLENGLILRVAAQAKSVSSIIGEILIYIIPVVIAAIVLSVFISIAITKSIIKPVEELGKKLDDVENVKTYTELMPFVNALQEQKQKQRELDRQKKQFTANMSHELKTPLTSIAGYAELIESGIAKEEDIKPFASVIRKQALRLVSLSEDIIQLSQLDENDGESIAFSSTDIYAAAEKCVEALSINARLKNIDMRLTGESCFIKANPTLLEELIYNLCDNAIRYNRENGSVTVSVEPLEDRVKLSVRDTGIGIDEKYQSRIFERFFRVDKSRSKETGGTGLGLAIVKHIVQLHEAELNIDSQLGKGTCISILFKK
ncbi:MAG: ATP-binding protein [Eubacterium sp.]